MFERVGCEEVKLNHVQGWHLPVMTGKSLDQQLMFASSTWSKLTMEKGWTILKPSNTWKKTIYFA